MHSIAAQMLLKILYQHITFFGFQPTTRVIFQDVTFHTNQIAAQSQITCFQFNPNAGSLQRTSTFINHMLVVSQNTAVGYFTSRMEAIRYCLQKTISSPTGKLVKIRCVSILQESLSSQSLGMPVCHTIT